MAGQQLSPAQFPAPSPNRIALEARLAADNPDWLNDCPNAARGRPGLR